MSDTTIQWTDKVWNPVRGCSRVSAGCGDSHGGGCYAERQAYRFSGAGMPYEGLVRLTKGGPRWTGKVVLVHEKLNEPLSWRKPSRVFVNSMSDLFHEALEDDDIDRVFATMLVCAYHESSRGHTFQVLTKRPERMAAYLSDAAARRAGWAKAAGFMMNDGDGWHDLIAFHKGPLLPPSIWLGTSVESQATADERIPHLLRIPAAVRFLSVEPMLEHIELSLRNDPATCSTCGGTGKITDKSHPMHPDKTGDGDGLDWCLDCDEDRAELRDGISWIIVGGESGPKARPLDLAWARSIVAQCKEAVVPVFCKQLGARPYEKRPTEGGARGTDEALARIGEEHPQAAWFRREGWCLTHTPDGQSAWYKHHRLVDKKGGDMSDWPDDLRVRQFPEVAR